MGKFDAVIEGLRTGVEWTKKTLAEKDSEINSVADRLAKLQAERIKIVESIEEAGQAIEVLKAKASDTDAA